MIAYFFSVGRAKVAVDFLYVFGIIIMFAGYGAVGSALVWGARGRQFKSGCSDYEMGSRSLQLLPFLLVRGING